MIDESDDEFTADYLVGEYQLAYGNEWHVSKRRAKENSGDDSGN